MIIGPDRKLYFTIGDLGANQLANFCNPNRAQSLPTAAQLRTRDWSLYEGKVLRLNLDGSIPSDNPTIGGVRSHIYSYGHRNPQGLVFAPDGKLYESEHGPNTDDEVNLIRAGANYGWPHVAGYRDDQSYAYANWSASKDVPCASLTYTAYPEVPPSVPVQKESAWSHPDFTPPIQTFRTVPTGYDFKNPKCAERELYYQCWPTVAPSSLAVYTAKNGIPGWDHSLLMPSLKHGTVYRMQLDAAGTAVVGEPDENMPLKTVNRYRDVTMRPDGLALFIVTDVGGNTQDAVGKAGREGREPRRDSRIPLRRGTAGSSCAGAARCAEARSTGGRTRARFRAHRSARPAAHVGVVDGTERPDAGVLSLGRLVTVLQDAARGAARPARRLKRQGLAVAAVSYDPVAVLADFAARRGITFPLLSDPGIADHQEATGSSTRRCPRRISRLTASVSRHVHAERARRRHVAFLRAGLSGAKHGRAACWRGSATGSTCRPRRCRRRRSRSPRLRPMAPWPPERNSLWSSMCGQARGIHVYAPGVTGYKPIALTVEPQPG